MWDFSIGGSLVLLARSWPFVALRAVVYFGMATAYVLATGMGGGVGWGIGAFGDEAFRATAIAWGGFLGFGLTAGIFYFLREYILYFVKAGHIAVLVELIEGRDVPVGRAQIDYAIMRVREQFAAANVLFGVDQLIKGVLVALLGLVQMVVGLLPIPGLDNMMGAFRAFMRLSVGLVDEVILGYLLRNRVQNPWEGAQTALVLYAQNYKLVLKNAAWLTLVVYALTLIVFLLALTPAAAVVWFIPNAWGAGAFVFALIFAWAVKAALIEPFAVAAMMSVYFRAIDGQSPDQTWRERIADVSGKFRDLGARAIGWGDARALP